MEFKRLKECKDKLHVCIRCGYCYEHCHIFKITNWESDTPRGKLILLYALLHEEIEPTDYMANKIFECFNCGRCDASCSAKVPVTEIFTDVRADFIDGGFDVKGTLSHINEDLCSKCGICVSICKYEARSFDKEQNKIIIDKVKCRSCGGCEAACPSGAAYIEEGYMVSDKEMSEQIQSYLGGK